MPCESEDMTWLYAESMRGFTWKREKKEARMMDGAHCKYQQDS
jgi:hypothetical protein